MTQANQRRFKGGVSMLNWPLKTSNAFHNALLCTLLCLLWPRNDITICRPWLRFFYCSCRCCCQVSTKSGLDPSGVWQAWGLASLVTGNLLGAREKLARCLKPPMDRSQLNLGPLLLQEVIRHLENDVPPTVSMVGGTSIVVVKNSCCLNSFSNTIQEFQARSE